ncbi:lipase family protein [Kutzneria albida]|uniref:Triacylglycerol lipase n=1 Tax=Kutzneria albida DSM 43870 TaxID=1449976 RepID=W5W2G1_9PSEU|nr:lipase family protein [Kutzneria albida]AHH94985.1 hypothetical protein KALB_1613 [Kutzneria albida DSM 43870]
MSTPRWTGRVALAAATLVLAGATAAVGTPAAAATAPPPPQSDPFYQPPSGYEATAPGTVLRSRQVEATAFGLLPQKVQSWQVLYRTTDTKGAPQATVTTVLLPYGAQPSATRPLVSYQVAEDSAAPQCAMSYQLRRGAGNENIVAQAEILLIDAALQQGWAVTVPDYEGPRSAYVAGRQAGQAVLDGIRATENFGPAGLNGVNTKVGAWGYSGGALASGWASELQASYAPELNVVGVAEGGLPVDPRSVLDAANGSFFAGIAMSGIAGLRQAYPELDDFLNTYLTPEGRTAFAKAASQCNSANAQGFAFTDLFKYFTIKDPLSQPVPKQVLSDVLMGKQTPKAPLFVYHSVNDELVPIKANSDTVVPRYCADGARVTYQRDILSEHVALVATGAPDALIWLKDRFADKPVAAGCTTSTVVSSLLSPEALRVLGTVLAKDLLALAGRPVGPADMV